MARRAKRKVQINTASGLADKRDNAMLREVNYSKNQELMHTHGPGSSNKPDVLTIHIFDDKSYTTTLQDLFGVITSTLYFDLIFPSHATVHKLDNLHQISKDVGSQMNAGSVGKEFVTRVTRQLGIARKRIEEQILYGNEAHDLKISLYDFILKATEGLPIDIRGLLPSM